MKTVVGFSLVIASILTTPHGLSAAQDDSVRRRDERIATAAEAMRPKLVEQRRDFHMHPELSNREERTSRIVAERLRALGLDEVQTGIAKHGVVALLKGAKPGPVVAVRADMDALPIQETIDVPYKSQIPGVKHACGHDVHTTVQLGVAEILSRMRNEITGAIKFIFQPAEEGAPVGEEGGASLMVKEGVLENPRPQAIFGLHVRPNVDKPMIEIGQIGYNIGPAMASSDRFTLRITGKMSHGAWPHEGIDAIVVAAECINALQTIRSRRIDTADPLVITIGKITGGNRFNIIADKVELEGTVRTLNEEVRQKAFKLMRETLAGITAAYSAKFELKFEDSNPVTYNEPKLAEETLPTLRRMVGATNVIPLKPVMGAEDFAFYQQVIPGFYYNLGVGNKAKGISAMLHTAEFDVDEESLVIGVKVMTSVLLDYLDRNSGPK
ncbi:MAG: amidohydrolase [Verrucomicrobia bacterium]|nr:MAG: amidohydrolase [Verrucomicrobiota bacterium]